MRTTIIALLCTLTATNGFSVLPTQSSHVTSTSLFGYVPSGFTPESWKAYKEKEEKKKKAANLGRLGPKGFQSRSMQSFQEALERGEADHLMPMFNAKEKLARGSIRKEDIPYMQRGGKWDNTDVKGARNQKRWLSSDKKYAAGGFKKEQSVSILGMGQGLDWTGKGARAGPESAFGARAKFPKGYKAPNVNEGKKKGPFGLW